MRNNSVKKMILSAVFLALGMVLPLLTGQIKEIGDSLLPMHLPVMLCGLLCGWQYGGFIGLVLPFLRSVTFGMPPIYPQAVWMALELCAYGTVIGLMYLLLKRKNILSIYISLITAMNMISMMMLIMNQTLMMIPLTIPLMTHHIIIIDGND